MRNGSNGINIDKKSNLFIKGPSHTLFDILDTLTTLQRVCLVLYYYGHYDVKEIAEELKINEIETIIEIEKGREKVKNRIRELYECEHIESPMLYFVLLVEMALEHMILDEDDSLKLYKRVFETN